MSTAQLERGMPVHSVIILPKVRQPHQINTRRQFLFLSASPNKPCSALYLTHLSKAFIMSRKLNTSQKWNAKVVDTDRELNAQIEAARSDPLQPNLRPWMATLQDIPMSTSCISSSHSLAHWLDLCLNPPQPGPPSPSSAVVPLDSSARGPPPPSSNVSMNISAT